jgi:hypothetical protein
MEMEVATLHVSEHAAPEGEAPTAATVAFEAAARPIEGSEDSPTPKPRIRKTVRRTTKSRGIGGGFEGRVQVDSAQAMNGAMAAIYGLSGGFMSGIDGIVQRALAEAKGLPPPGDDVRLRESGDALVAAATTRLSMPSPTSAAYLPCYVMIIWPARCVKSCAATGGKRRCGLWRSARIGGLPRNSAPPR